MPAWPAPARGPSLGPTGATSSGEVNSAIATGSSWGASANTAQSQRSSTTFGAFNTAYGTVPGANADTATKLEFLNMQLASIGTDRVVLERFRLLGPSHRRQGGALRAVTWRCAPGCAFVAASNKMPAERRWPLFVRTRMSVTS